MLTFVFFLTGYILGWQCFVGAEDIHCMQSVLLTAAQPQPLLAFPQVPAAEAVSHGAKLGSQRKSQLV